MIWPPARPIALLPVTVGIPVLRQAAGRGRPRRAVMAGQVLFRLYGALEDSGFGARHCGNGFRIAIC